MWVTFAASYTQSMIMPPHHPDAYTADWWKAAQAKAEDIRAEQEQIAEQYERMTKDQEARINREEREQFAARR